MSYLYEKYLELKGYNKEIYYLFEVGSFYIFLDNDAIEIANLLNLKLTYYSKNVIKCGFPKKSLNKYEMLFKKNNLNYKIVHKYKNNTYEINDKVIKMLKNINLLTITPIEAISFLNDIKGLLND